MADTDINGLTPVSSVEAGDEFVVQKAGEFTAKKATTNQITQIEETARELGDDTIEASAGINTDGTYPAMTNSWYLRAADFVTGLVDRVGAEASVVANLWNAIRMLDATIYANSYALSSTVRTAEITCSAADILACNAVPKVLIAGEADYVIEPISVTGRIAYNSSPYSAGTDKLEIRNTSGNKFFELANALLEGGSDLMYRGVNVVAQEQLVVGDGLQLYCATPPTGGNSPIVITILYRKFYATS